MSGLFGSLQSQYESRIQSGAQRAEQQAQADQDSADSDAQSKWTNGQMSDGAWLAYIRSRILSSAGDPAETEKWKNALRENEGAISDAQIEADFSLGKVSIATLMSHYNKRMSGVEHNSPAYRALVQRYAQLSQAAQTTGGSYRTGSRGSSKAAKGAKAKGTAVASGKKAVSEYGGIDATGENVIIPESVLTGTDSAKDYINDLDADMERIKSINLFIKANPDSPTFYDATTGQTFNLNKTVLLALDKQNIRNNNLRAAYYAATGDSKKSAAALNDNSYFVNNVLPEHNTMMTKDVRDASHQNVLDTLVSLSHNPDPAARTAGYATLAKQLAGLNESIYANVKVGSDTPVPHGVPQAELRTVTAKATGLMPDDKTKHDDFNLQYAIEMLGDPSVPDDQLQTELGRIFEETPTLGSGGSSINLKTLLEGPDTTDGSSSDLPAGYIGPIHNRQIYMGLLYADDPTYTGPKFVYAMEDGALKAVAAKVGVSHKSGGVNVPTLTPDGADPNNSFQTRQIINGEAVTVWGALQPIDDPAYSVYRLQKDLVVNGVTYKKGGLLPSIATKFLGMSGLNGAEGKGDIQRQSTVSGITLADGTVWYHDNEGGAFYHGKLPALTNADPVTGGLMVNQDGGAADILWGSFSSGVAVPFSAKIPSSEMQGWIDGEVTAGRISPYDFTPRDAGGMLVHDQPVDFGHMYVTDKALQNAAFMPGIYGHTADRLDFPDTSSVYGHTGDQRDAMASFDAQQEAARMGKAQQWVQANLTSTDKRNFARMGVDPAQYAAQKLKDYGASVGLTMNFDAGAPVDQPTGAQKSQRMLDIMNPNADAIAARANRNKLAVEQAATPRFIPRGLREAALKPVVTTPVVLTPPPVDRSYMPPLPAAASGGNRRQVPDFPVTPAKPKGIPFTPTKKMTATQSATATRLTKRGII